MKENLLYTIYFLTLVISCGDIPSINTAKKLHLLVENEIYLDGSVMIVDNGVLVLVRNTDELKPIVLIPKNDSIHEAITCAYQQRLDSGCRLDLKPWVGLKGTYIRHDTIHPIFRFFQIKILDDAFSCSMIAEE